MTKVAILLSVLVLAGCATLPQNLRQSLTVIIPHQVDFDELEYYALRSDAAYKSASKIRRTLPNTTRVATVATVDVQYFIETDRSNKTQTLVIRGSADKPNAWQDIEIRMVEDDTLGINLHQGFRDDSREIFKDARRHLRKDYAIRVSGHSLGGALAMITAAYLAKDGYDVVRLVTFGQPKVTDYEGDQILLKSITRVVHDNDVVPMLPPSGIQSANAGDYRHIGPEIVLRDGSEYVYLDTHNADRLSVGQFWRNITDFSGQKHHMVLYLDNIQEKAAGSTRQVPYFGPSASLEVATR
jgi:triacylglycerol lipase